MSHTSALRSTRTMACTFHTYPELLHDGGRLAQSSWAGWSAGVAVAATLEITPDAVILRAENTAETFRGLAPGGLAA